jgi:hypothetical protein
MLFSDILNFFLAAEYGRNPASILVGPRHQVTICYLKKGQRPPQGNGPFFDPFSGKKSHMTSWTNHRVRTTFLTPPFSPYSFISIGLVTWRPVQGLL